MEKEKEMLVVPGDFGWADVGHWRAVAEVLGGEGGGNIARGNYISYDSKGNLIYNFSKKLIGTCGLENMIIVETDEALLVCPKNKAQLVKNLVEEMEKSKFKNFV
jgi:mannose-1-phosphate guanylyltransferase